MRCDTPRLASVVVCLHTQQSSELFHSEDRRSGWWLCGGTLHDAALFVVDDEFVMNVPTSKLVQVIGRVGLKHGVRDRQTLC